MSRPTNHAPSICHNRNRRSAYVTIAGKQKTLGRWDEINDRPSVAAVAAYHRLMSQSIAAARSGDLADGTCETIAELCAAHVAHIQRRVEAGRRAQSELSHVRTVVRAILADPDRAAMAPEKFGPKALRTVRDLFIDRGLARRTVNQNTARVKLIFQWGGSEELIDPLIYDRLRCVAGLRTRERASFARSYLPFPGLPATGGVTSGQASIQQGFRDPSHPACVEAAKPSAGG